MIKRLLRLWRLGSALLVRPRREGKIIVPRGRVCLGSRMRPITSLSVGPHSYSVYKTGGANTEALRFFHDTDGGGFETFARGAGQRKGIKIGNIEIPYVASGRKEDMLPSGFSELTEDGVFRLAPLESSNAQALPLTGAQQQRLRINAGVTDHGAIKEEDWTYYSARLRRNAPGRGGEA